jgi:hypothetical protein
MVPRRSAPDPSGDRVSISSPRAFLHILFLAGILLLSAGCASSSVPRGRLADGSSVPEGASFTPPAPTSKMPQDLPGRIGSSGVRGVFRAEVVITEAGAVADVMVTHSLGDAADAGILPALRRLAFTAAMLDGKPVAAIYVATFNFTSSR